MGVYGRGLKEGIWRLIAEDYMFPFMEMLKYKKKLTYLRHTFSWKKKRHTFSCMKYTLSKTTPCEKWFYNIVFGLVIFTSDILFYAFPVKVFKRCLKLYLQSLSELLSILLMNAKPTWIMLKDCHESHLTLYLDQYNLIQLKLGHLSPASKPMEWGTDKSYDFSFAHGWISARSLGELGLQIH